MRILLAALAMTLSATAFAGVHFELNVMNSSNVKTFNTKDHPNGVFAIEAYFLTCPYCNYNAGNVDELAANNVGNKNVHVLDVGYDCRQSQYSGWISKHSPNHLVLNDCGGQKLLGKLGVRSFPTFILLDCNGNEVYRTGGVWNAAKKAQIQNKIDATVAACAAK